MIAHGDQREQKIRAHADDGEVAGTLANDQEQVFRRIEAQSGWRIAGGNGETFSGIANDAAIKYIDRRDAAGGGVRNVKQSGVLAEDPASGRRSQDHVVADLVSRSVDGLEAVSLRRNHVEFAAIGLEQHVGGLAGQLEIGDKNTAAQVDPRAAALGTTQYKSEGRVRQDDDVSGLS